MSSSIYYGEGIRIKHVFEFIHARCHCVHEAKLQKVERTSQQSAEQKKMSNAVYELRKRSDISAEGELKPETGMYKGS